jgi:hypothetical protein|tara:strand:- start:91 stop:249 length:159 start_codon:yes stop_codon:yes gene_type:complete
MVSYRIQTKDKNVLHTVEHGEKIDILEDMECLGMLTQLEMYNQMVEDGMVRP